MECYFGVVTDIKMANLPEHMTNQLKQLLESHQYSDLILKITELPDDASTTASGAVSSTSASATSAASTSVALSTSTASTEPKLTMKVHRLILFLNSPHFAGVDMSEDTTVEISVKHGSARFVELLVKSFYDKSVVTQLTTPDLLSLLQCALLYGSGDIVVEISKLLDNVQADSFDTSNNVLEQLQMLENRPDLNIDKELLIRLKSKFTKYLAVHFCPLEVRTVTHAEFLSLRYGALLVMLQSGEKLTDSENSLLMFVLEWLRRDPQRQNGENIGRLLKNIRVKFLSAAFLHNTVTFRNHTFCKWDGFVEWIVNALAYLGRTAEQRKEMTTVDSELCRNASTDPHAWFVVPHREGNCPRAVRWLVYMSPVEENERFEPMPHILLTDGARYSLERLTITPSDVKGLFDLTVRISASFLLGTQFVLGVVPADREYGLSKICFHRHFRQRFLKWTEEWKDEGNVAEYTLWQATQDFVDLVNQHGVYLCVLPVTKWEYAKLSMMKFGIVGHNFHIHRGIQQGTHTSPPKIRLESSSNFSNQNI